MDMLKQERNRGYLISGIAGIIGFIAFFLPYATVSLLFGTISFNGPSLGGWLWLEFLITLLLIAVPAILIYKNNAFGLSNMPVEQQIRWGRYVLIGAGAFGLLLQIIFAITVSNITSGDIPLGSLISLGFGFWLYLLAMIAAIIGGILALRTATVVQPQSPQYSPYQQTQYPPYQQNPYSSQPYPPQEQQNPYSSQPYPPQSQSQYPPAQEQPPQQWPPSQ